MPRYMCRPIGTSRPVAARERIGSTLLFVPSKTTVDPTAPRCTASDANVPHGASAGPSRDRDGAACFGNARRCLCRARMQEAWRFRTAWTSRWARLPDAWPPSKGAGRRARGREGPTWPRSQPSSPRPAPRWRRSSPTRTPSASTARPVSPRSTAKGLHAAHAGVLRWDGLPQPRPSTRTEANGRRRVGSRNAVPTAGVAGRGT